VEYRQLVEETELRHRHLEQQQQMGHDVKRLNLHELQ